MVQMYPVVLKKEDHNSKAAAFARAVQELQDRYKCTPFRLSVAKPPLRAESNRLYGSLICATRNLHSPDAVVVTYLTYMEVNDDTESIDVSSESRDEKE